MMLAFLVLGLVTLQRLAELAVSRRNTRRLLARGAYEVGRSHYPAIVVVHALWLLALWIWAPGRPIVWPLIGVFVLLQAARIWVLATLAGRWTTRIIVLPGTPLVARGPFRLVRHPNYVVVAAEIAVLPLAFGLWQIALLFSLLNAAVLWLRISIEERALRGPAPIPADEDRL